jgi:hypothetical protein
MLKLFQQCPACGGPITITECKCEQCHLQLRGEFATGPFSGFSEDQWTFVHAFIKARGNLSELEKVLGVSYPTIRNKLDEVIALLERSETEAKTMAKQPLPSPETQVKDNDSARKAILAQVASREITAAEGLARLQNLQGDKS